LWSEVFHDRTLVKTHASASFENKFGNYPVFACYSLLCSQLRLRYLFAFKGMGGDFCGRHRFTTAQWVKHTLPRVLKLFLGTAIPRFVFSRLHKLAEVTQSISPNLPANSIGVWGVIFAADRDLSKESHFQHSALYKIVTQAICPVLTVRA